MPCTEAYREHIMYTFNGYCKTVIRFAAITAWRDRSRRRQKEISFEYLTEEKFYPLGTTDEFLKSPYEQYPVTICGQTVILTNGELAAALLSLPEKRGKSFTFTFSGITHSRKSRIYTGIARVRHGITSTAHYRCCRKKWRDFHMGNTNLVPYETIVRATSGEPEAVDEVLRHYSKRIRFAAHLFWLQINLIDCHRINRYNDISIEKEKVPEHLFFCRDKCSGTIFKHGYYIKIRNRIQYTCSNYSKTPVGVLCPTQHRINESAVLTLVSDMLRAVAEYSKNNRAEFVRTVQETQAVQQASDISKKKKRLAAAQKRAGELEKLICKIYEDNVLGKLPDARYAALDAQYAQEQNELSGEIAALEKAIGAYEQTRKSAEKFIALIDKYENFDSLTVAMLNEFVEKILVHERDRKGSIETTQEIEIYFNFVGKYMPPHFGEVNLTPEELEALRKKEERKDKLHQAYLRRKESG